MVIRGMGGKLWWFRVFWGIMRPAFPRNFNIFSQHGVPSLSPAFPRIFAWFPHIFSVFGQNRPHSFLLWNPMRSACFCMFAHISAWCGIITFFRIFQHFYFSRDWKIEDIIQDHGIRNFRVFFLVVLCDFFYRVIRIICNNFRPEFWVYYETLLEFPYIFPKKPK